MDSSSSPFLLRLHFHASLEGDERVCPETLKVGPQRGHRLRIDGVQAARSLRAVRDQVGVLQNPEMLGNTRAADRELARKFADRQRTLMDQAGEDRSSGGVAEGVKLCRVVSIHLP
jgi:hypothetical protein